MVDEASSQSQGTILDCVNPKLTLLKTMPDIINQLPTKQVDTQHHFMSLLMGTPSTHATVPCYVVKCMGGAKSFESPTVSHIRDTVTCS